MIDCLVCDSVVLLFADWLLGCKYEYVESMHCFAVMLCAAVGGSSGW